MDTIQTNDRKNGTESAEQHTNKGWFYLQNLGFIKLGNNNNNNNNNS